MKLQEKTYECWSAVKENGGRISTGALAKALGVAVNSVTGRVNSLVRNGLAVREAVDEGGDKPVKYVVLTDDGMNYVHTED